VGLGGWWDLFALKLAPGLCFHRCRRFVNVAPGIVEFPEFSTRVAPSSTHRMVPTTSIHPTDAERAEGRAASALAPWLGLQPGIKAVVRIDACNALRFSVAIAQSLRVSTVVALANRVFAKRKSTRGVKMRSQKGGVRKNADLHVTAARLDRRGR
jgi:hypothetical protein